jgi:tetratricopeptide (TPR) repeat protein
MLNYALSRVKLDDFPEAHKNMLRFRIGEIQMKSKLYPQAVQTLGSVAPGSEWYSKAKYLEGLAYVESGKLNNAVQTFADLSDAEKGKGVNHINRVGALMGLARVYYQQQNWDAAIDIYRQIPRDSELWHDTLFEMSWAQMRAAQFRNVLSNFHSLHSPYYEDFYIPESLLLRAIVYLYICQYDEMEKTLDLFDHIYKPVLADLTNFLKAYSKPLTYYDEVAIQQDNFEDLKKNRDNRRKFAIPFLVARHIMQEGDYSRVRSYIMAIRKEMSTLGEQPKDWQNSEIGQYAGKLLKGRLNNARKVAGVYVRNHVNNIRKDLAQLFEQHGFARFEMFSGRKETIKKQIAGKDLAKNVDGDTERDFYIQNGYEYWTFQGEYWLDEIGNYHYLGTQSCE